MTETKTAAAYTAALPSGGTLCILRVNAERAYPEPAGDTLLVIDDRGAKDPSFRIVDSCRIVRRRRKRDILRAILAYDAAYPTDPPWKRTLASMEKEWIIHNAAWRLGLFRSRAEDVDLNNAGEGRGWLHFFRRGVATLLERLPLLSGKK